MVKWAGLVPCWQKSREWNLPFIQAVPLSSLPWLPGQSPPYDQFSIQPLFQVPECLIQSVFLYLLKVFYPQMNKPNIHANFTGISSFQNGLNHPFSSTCLYFKSNCGKQSWSVKIMFFNFQTLFLKRYIFEVVEVFSRLVLIQSIQFFGGSIYQ